MRQLAICIHSQEADSGQEVELSYQTSRLLEGARFHQQDFTSSSFLQVLKHLETKFQIQKPVSG